MVLDYLKEDCIMLNYCANDWEDAVKCAGNILLKNGYVYEAYVQRMVDIVKEVGPYIVIDKGLALAHARPEDGAREMGLSLVTLKNPVEFGNEDNDPVKIVIGLSAMQADSHIELIAQLADLLIDEESVNKIASAQCAKEVIELLEKYN